MVFLGIDFTVAEFLILCLSLLNTVLLLVLIKKASGKKTEKAAPVPAEARAVPAQETGDDELELVAVIAAAIAEFEGTDPENIRIKDINEVKNNDVVRYRSNWSVAGRREQVNRYI